MQSPLEHGEAPTLRSSQHHMMEQGERAAALLSGLTMGADGIDVDKVLEAFRLDSSDQSRAASLVLLSQTKEDVPNVLRKGIVEALARQDDKSQGLISVTRLLNAVHSVRPDAARLLLFERGLLEQILNKSASSSSPGEDYTPAFFAAELLSTLANEADSRKWLLRAGQTDHNGEESRIVEIDTTSKAPVRPMSWLLAFMEKANVQNAESASMLFKVALLSSLAMHKIRRGSKESETKAADGDTVFGKGDSALAREEDPEGDVQLLLSLSRSCLTASESGGDEIQRCCRLASVESLAYLTLDTQYRKVLVEDQKFLQSLCRVAKGTVIDPQKKSKPLFPTKGRTGSETQVTSSYELDKSLSTPQMASVSSQDYALQYGMATLFNNITAYPPLLSAEEKQMQRLRKMASAKAEVKGQPEGEESVDELMSIDAIQTRCSKVIAAGGAEALSLMAHGGPSRSQVRSSSATRDTIGKTMLSLTTQQAKTQRGKIIQQGGAKALLALSTEVLADVLQGKAAKVPFESMQALAHLLITEDPRIVLRDPAEGIPALVFLYLHASSSLLQRFEAALALTNVASLDERTARAILRCSFPQAVVENVGLNGLNAKEGGAVQQGEKKKIGMSHVLHERIFLEDNEMCRRSSLELLCNLLVADEETFKQWSGEQEDQEREKGDREIEKATSEGRVVKNFCFLLALCSPVGIKQATSTESGLQVRLAAGGVLATLCSSPSACARMLSIEDRLLRRASDLVYFIPSSTSKADQLEEGEEDEITPQNQDLSQDRLGPHHAALQLALRGLTILDCLIQYIAWLQGQGGSRDVTQHKNKLKEANVAAAIEKLALSMAAGMKQTPSDPAIRALRDQVAQQAFDSLRACKSLNLI